MSWDQATNKEEASDRGAPAQSSWTNNNNNTEQAQAGWGGQTETAQEKQAPAWGEAATSNQDQTGNPPAWTAPVAEENKTASQEAKKEVAWGSRENDEARGTYNDLDAKPVQNAWGATASIDLWGTGDSKDLAWGTKASEPDGRTNQWSNRGGGGNSFTRREGSVGSRACFKCNEEGHMSRECPQGGGGGGGAGGSRACFKCGEEGHMSRECPQGGGGGGAGAGGSRACFKCGEEGHISRECPQGGGGGGGSRACYNCGEEGHMSRECTQERKPGAGRGGGGGGGRSCYNCGEDGHMSRECPQPRNENNRGRGRGRGRGGFESSSFGRDDQPMQESTSGAAWGSTDNKDEAWGNSAAGGGAGADWNSSAPTASAAAGGGWGESAATQQEAPSQAKPSDEWSASAKPQPVQDGGWGGAQKETKENPQSNNASDQWASAPTKQEASGGGWGAESSQPAPKSDNNNDSKPAAADAWGSQVPQNSTSGGGWGEEAPAAQTAGNGGGAWGSDSKQAASSSGAAWGNETTKQVPSGSSGGGPRGMWCYKCDQEGHMSRNCPSDGGSGAPAGGGNSGSRACFKCNEEGHMSRECPQGGNAGGSRACFKCGEEGHMSRECPQSGGGGGGGGAGGSRACFKCGEEGHISRECPQGGGGGGGSRACYNCGEEGHMSRDCTQERKPGAGRGGGGGGGGGRSCYNCGEDGHMSRECPQPRNENNRGRGRGRGRGGFESSSFGRDDQPMQETTSGAAWGSTENKDEAWDSSAAGTGAGADWNSSAQATTAVVDGGWGADTNTKQEVPKADGATASEKKEQPSTDPWASIPTQAANSEPGGWGDAPKEEQKTTAWGDQQQLPAESKPADAWGATDNTETKPADGGWGATTETEAKPAEGGWGATDTENKPAGNAWGQESAGATKVEQSDAWGSAQAQNTSWGGSGPSQPAAQRGGASGRGCFKCGEEGHMSRECPQGGGGGGAGAGGSRACFKCGEEGHMSRECPQGGGGGGAGAGGSRACFKCGEEGHISRECPQGGGGGGGSRACYNCGEEGHMSRDCTQERKPGAGRGGGGGGGGRSCYNCGEDGHMSRECPQPRNENNRGRGRGRGRGGFESSSFGRDDQPMQETTSGAGWGSADNKDEAWGSSAAGGGADWNSSAPKTQAAAGGGWGESAATQQEAPKAEGGWDQAAPSQAKPSDEWSASAKPQPVQDGGWGAQEETKEKPKSNNASDQWAGAPAKQEASGGGWGAESSQPPAQQDGGWAAQSSQPATQKDGGWGGQSSQPAVQKEGGWGASQSANNDNKQEASAADPWSNQAPQASASGGGWGEDAAPTAQASGGWGADEAPQVKTQGAAVDEWGAGAPAPAQASGGWGDDAPVVQTSGGWNEDAAIPAAEEVIPEKDPFNGLHPCILQICLTQSDRDMSESEPEEDIKEGYNSDDANSLKTIGDQCEYEESKEEIDLTDAPMADAAEEELKCSAQFSDKEDEKMSVGEVSGNFSDFELPDKEQVEQQSILNEINRDLEESLMKSQLLDEDVDFEFSRRLQMLCEVKQETKKVVKREYVSYENQELDPIRTQLDSISNHETVSNNNQDTQSQASSVLKAEYPLQDRFTVKFLRRNLIVDLDRTFIDIMDMQQYHFKLKSMHSDIKNAFCNDGDMHQIVFNGIPFVVIVRKGTQEFFQQLSKKYTIYVVSFICRDLILQLLRLIDPKETAFKHANVKFYEPQQSPKHTQDALQSAYNSKDYIVIDRVERDWLYEDQKKMILIKTFAPLSGPILTEPNLGLLPIAVKRFQKIQEQSSYQQYPPMSPTFNDFAQQQQPQVMPDVLVLSEKQHMVLTSEAMTESTLEKLQTNLIDAFDAVIEHQGPTGEVTVMDWFAQYTQQRYMGKTFSLAFYKEKEEVSEANMDDTLRAIHEILYERLGATKIIYDKRSHESVDFYLFEETLETNVNDKRKALRKRRDVMSFLKAKAKLAMVAGKDAATNEKEALSSATKKLVLQSRCIKDIFDYFFRSR